MTDKQLSAIRARAEAATPGPWKFEKWRKFGDGLKIVGKNNADVMSDGSAGGEYAETTTIENMTFFLHCKQDIPALLAHIEELKTALGKQVWTTEPKCGAWNWWRLGTFDPPSCRYVFTDGTINTYRFGRILCKELGGEWCPIPTPKEPNP